MIVALGAVWAYEIMGLFGYGLTLLSSLIAPLIIVIGVPNCIYLINKYHQEYKKHGPTNQGHSTCSKQSGGYIALITNTTTALGFAAFILTSSENLIQFGVVSSLSILAIFILSLVLVPVIYSYVSPPKERHLNHFDVAWLISFLDFLDDAVENKRKWVYGITGVAVIFSHLWRYADSNGR